MEIISQDVTQEERRYVALASTMRDALPNAITTQGDAEAASTVAQDAHLAIKKVEAFFEPMLEAAKANLKAVRDRMEGVLAPLREVKETQKRLLSDFLRREEARLQAEAALERQKRQEEALAQAARFEDAGLDEVATDILDDAIVAIPAVTKAKVAGVSKRETWVATVIDKAKLDPSFLVPDEKTIAALVRAKGPEAEAILGVGSVRIEKVISTSMTGRR